MNITITQRFTCPDCHTIGEGMTFPTVRVLKHRLVQERALGVWPKRCSCGREFTPDDRTEDVIDPADLERINRQRERKGWPPMPATIRRALSTSEAS